MNHNWQAFRAGRADQILLKDGADIAALSELDRKSWMVLSMPVKDVRFDRRMLELMDLDHDGRIRIDEVLGAIEFLKAHDVDLNTLFTPDDVDEKALVQVMDNRGNVEKLPLSAEEEKAFTAWEVAGEDPKVRVLGADTASAEATLAAVEAVVDTFFTATGDEGLVTEEPAKRLPLEDHIHPKYAASIRALNEKCVTPILGVHASLDYLDWQALKAAFAPYRAHCAAKPVAHANLQAQLDDEERVLRYKMHLLELLENFVNMKRLFSANGTAIFQVGTLRIDAREMSLCFAVENEEAHSALSGRSKCCVLYLGLTHPATSATRTICAVVTAGSTGRLYVGRKGVFLDYDGHEWEAVITKIVENQVSLMEAFWAPWKKVGEGIGALVKKFLGDKQANAVSTVSAGAQDAKMGGAAMASSVAAIGIGIGMIGAALASILAAVSQLTPWQIPFAVVAVILIVSLPSVVLTAFKLRQRDLGAVLNASGWAVNRPVFISLKRAKAFTLCACNYTGRRVIAALFVLIILGIGAFYGYQAYKGKCAAKCPAPAPAAEATPAAHPQA